MVKIWSFWVELLNKLLNKLLNEKVPQTPILSGFQRKNVLISGKIFNFKYKMTFNKYEISYFKEL